MTIGTAALARRSARRPWRTVALWVVLLITAGVLSSQLLGGALTTSVSFTDDPESTRALELIEEAQEMEEQANAADDKARIFELAGLIFAIGLAAIAWAALVRSGRRIRFVFLLIALLSLAAGLTVIIQIVLI